MIVTITDHLIWIRHNKLISKPITNDNKIEIIKFKRHGNCITPKRLSNSFQGKIFEVIKIKIQEINKNLSSKRKSSLVFFNLNKTNLNESATNGSVNPTP